ncbi:MAG: AAA family ATPase [Eggerthellaceae bacterium]|nr:AAA family ATPase [Eggerthellaceae bacterium]
MLLNFEVENWMSYRNCAAFRTTGSLERQHMETLAKIPGFRSKKALPVVAVYGGNASGKTGLFKALAALKVMVTRDFGVNGILPIEPFKLDDESIRRPTTFDITFLAGKTVYRLVVEATIEGVSYESLEIVKEKETIDIYERDAGKTPSFEFNEAYFADLAHVEYVAKSTRDNQLFLGRAMADNVTELAEPFLWFANVLELVGVGSDAWAFATALEKKEGFLEYASETLSRLDTGISRLEGQRVGVDLLPPNAELRRHVNQLSPNEGVTIIVNQSVGDYGFEMFTVRSVNGKPEIQRLSTVHVGPDGAEHSFSLAMESSGTQRLMVLLPMLFDLSGSGGQVGSKVYVVDELDRCLHTMLTKRLLEDFLDTCGPDTRKQMLFTTHDLLLMDQSLMRRDEMYISQRDANGCSELIGLSEFEGIRFDKDLIRSYLDGRFGGIPMLGEVVIRG